MVVKLGSSVIAPKGKLDQKLVGALVADILNVKKAGYEVAFNYDIEVMHPRTLIEEFRAVMWWASGTPYLGQNRIVKAVKYLGAGCLYGLLLATTDPRLILILPARGLIQAYGALK